eukprot:m.128401 g.128401  ORF g.128401 m.128401 type:complete len:603 (+) comp37953_c0_seq19:3198-5006(+)
MSSTSPGIRIELFGCAAASEIDSGTSGPRTASPTSRTVTSATVQTTQKGQGTEMSPSGGLSGSTLLIVILSSVGGIIIILVVIVILVVKKRKVSRKHCFSDVQENMLTSDVPPKTSKRPETTVRYVSSPQSSIPEKSNAENTLTVADKAEYIDVDDVAVVEEVAANCNAAKIICASELEIGEILGAGEFGTVCKAIWSAQKIEVAVKTLKPEVSGKAKNDFLREASVMCSCDHPHLVQLLGVCIDEPALLITELAGYGSLGSYLKKRTPGGKSTLDNVQLDRQLDFAGQIAQAMIYLSSKKLVHRDLATRNVLVFSSQLVKVSDFGLSRACDTGKEYYAIKTHTKLPLRWMAPETWNYRKFTPMSDVWSFGVTLWEIMSYGSKPYSRLKSQDVPGYVESGKRLLQPDRCPDKIYDIMLACWHSEPQNRIAFPALGEKLRSSERTKKGKKQSTQSISGPVMISFQNLKLGEELGKGAFGAVRQASWKQENGDETEVAVKSISPEASPKDKDAFLKEALVMTKLDHENIVRFIGVCFEQQSVLVVSELVSFGCLRKYVQKNDLEEPVLLKFSIQIANGMAFLEEARIVHRDLATRNVLADVQKI